MQLFSFVFRSSFLRYLLFLADTSQDKYQSFSDLAVLWAWAVSLSPIVWSSLYRGFLWVHYWWFCVRVHRSYPADQSLCSRFPSGLSLHPSYPWWGPGKSRCLADLQIRHRPRGSLKVWEVHLSRVQRLNWLGAHWTNFQVCWYN